MDEQLGALRASPLTAAAAPHRARPAARGLRWWFALLVLCCTLPASFLAALYLAYDYHRERERITRDTMVTARALAAAVDRDLAATKSALLALASSPYLADGDLINFHAQALQALSTQTALNIVLIGPQHRQLLNTLVPYGSPLPMERNSALLKVLDTGKPVVSDLFSGPVAKRSLLAVGVPVQRMGGVAYVLAAGVEPVSVGSALRLRELPAEWVAGVFDSSGTVVARTHDAGTFVGRKGSADLLRELGRQPEGVFEGRTLEGTPVLTVFTHCAESNWTVAIGIPRDSLAQPLRGAALGLLAATFALLAAALAIAWLIGRRIQHAVRALVPAALALGKGHAVEVGVLGLAEVDEVGSALNSASTLLQQALQRAHHDPLTGLANRSLLDELLRTLLAASQRTGRPVALLYIDLDGFKAINDRYGHARGDEVLRWVAQRLRDTVRLSDSAARLGGDEFVMLLPDADVDGAAQVATKVLQVLAEPWPDSTVQLPVSASIGISVFPLHAGNAEDLVRRADSAMYAAKAAGKHRFMVAKDHD